MITLENDSSRGSYGELLDALPVFEAKMEKENCEK